MQPGTSILRRSLVASTIDGTLYAVMLGCGETYFPAFALLLGASPFQVGLLATFPILVGAGFQLLSPLPARWVGNKTWVVLSAILQAATFVPIAILAWHGRGGFVWLLLWVCLYWMLALGINPAWNAWMGRMIPPQVRSRYFGRRNVPIQAALLVSLVAGGMVVHGAEGSLWGAAMGFAVIFAIAAAARGASAWFLTRQFEPEARQQRLRPPTQEILRGFRDAPYGRLILFLILMSGAVHASAAYFTPFMLEELDLSYARFTILNGTVLVSRILFSSYWGEIAHRYGNRRALQVAGVLVIPLPALWLASSDFGYLIVLQIWAGFAWSGFELATVLSFFDCTDDENRAQVLSLYNLLNALLIVTSSTAGGTVLKVLGHNGYLVVFAASTVLRTLTVIFFARGAGTKRAVEYTFRDVFVRVISMRPGQGPALRPIVMNHSSRPDSRRSRPSAK